MGRLLGARRVQERFWGLPWWNTHLVVLTNHIFRDGETYFIDGERAPGAMTRFFPVVEADYCTRTRRVADATVELRLLREAPPASEARILGQVRNPRRPEELNAANAPSAVDWAGLSEGEIAAFATAAEVRKRVESHSHTCAPPRRKNSRDWIVRVHHR
jgi:hypothetical protein